MKKQICLALFCLAAVGCGSSDNDGLNGVSSIQGANVAGYGTTTTTTTTTTSSSATATTSRPRNPDVAGANTSGVRNPGATNAASDTSSPDEPADLHKGLVELTQAEYDAQPDQIEPDAFDGNGDLTAKITLPASAAVTLAPPVADQGQTGSCAAHTGYLLGSQAQARRTGVAPTTPDHFASRGWLYRKILATENPDGQLIDPADNQLKGSNILNYLRQFVSQGAPAESEVDYPSVQLPMAEMEPAIVAIDITSPRNFQFVAGSYALIKETDSNQILDQIKRNLATNHPVGFGAKLSDDFNSYASGVYIASSPFTPGGHAMTVVGYDDNLSYTGVNGQPAQGAFRIQNSWNPTGWGEAGYAWVSYEAFIRATAESDSTPEYYVLDPQLNFPQETTGGALNSANSTPDGAVLQSKQLIEDGKTLLVFSTSFGAAHTLQTIELTQPNGTTVRQTLSGNLFRSGHLQFSRSDGNQFPTGSYIIRFNYDGGSSVATVDVPALTDSTLPAAPLDGQGEEGANGQPVTVE